MDEFICIDCKVDTSTTNEYYMVADPIWKKAKMGPDDGMLCIGCLEKRLGRKLENKDFSDLPINNPSMFEQSKRLANRLSTKRQPSVWK